MNKYSELKTEKEELHTKLMSKTNTQSEKVNPTLELMEEKKRQLLKLSSEVQEKITKLEQLQSNQTETENE
jgi:phage terminase small subunit